ncbi:MAG TPA: alpha/beta hydrolase [Dehalococcoidia bacterium]|jgi:dienelactone hydrolase|nr:alpha/beta hydrolase [Dehalococcoidia bacterium]
MNPYDYANGELQANLALKGTTQRWWHYAVDFPTAHPTHHARANTVRGEYFQPRNTAKAPLAIVLHGMGDPSLLPARCLARALAKEGIACFILYLIFHSSRLPQTMQNRLHKLSAEEWFEGYRLSVIETRQVLDWATGRGELDGERIALIGISFGGFISAITMGIDERIKAGVFITAAGNSEKISRQSRNPLMKKYYQRSEAEYREIQRQYARYLAEVAEKGFERVTPARQSFLTDPMTFAPYLRGRPMLMLNAAWDEYIPREAAQEFWEACGKPAITWLPATHGTIWLWYPLIRRKITRFLKSTFGIDSSSS